MNKQISYTCDTCKKTHVNPMVYNKPYEKPKDNDKFVCDQCGQVAMFKVDGNDQFTLIELPPILNRVFFWSIGEPNPLVIKGMQIFDKINKDESKKKSGDMLHTLIKELMKTSMPRH